MKNLVKSLTAELRKHFADYLILFTAGAFFLVGIKIFRGEKMIEFILLLAFASFYIIWGIYHHIVENTLRLKTVIEYILIGFIIIFLTKIVIFP